MANIRERCGRSHGGSCGSVPQHTGQSSCVLRVHNILRKDSAHATRTADDVRSYRLQVHPVDVELVVATLSVRPHRLQVGARIEHVEGAREPDERAHEADVAQRDASLLLDGARGSQQRHAALQQVADGHRSTAAHARAADEHAAGLTARTLDEVEGLAQPRRQVEVFGVVDVESFVAVDDAGLAVHATHVPEVKAGRQDAAVEDVGYAHRLEQRYVLGVGRCADVDVGVDEGRLRRHPDRRGGAEDRPHPVDVGLVIGRVRRIIDRVQGFRVPASGVQVACNQPILKV